jgi:hypothetical protein
MKASKRACMSLTLGVYSKSMVSLLRVGVVVW